MIATTMNDDFLNGKLPVLVDIGEPTTSPEIDFEQFAIEATEEVERLPDPEPRELSAPGQFGPTVDDFPIDVFPDTLRELVEQTSLFYQYRPDWIGSSILYAASVAVGNSVGTRYNGWEQKATLYIALVGMPGSNKSGPAEFAIKPIRRINSTTYKAFKEQKVEFERWEKLTKKERASEGLPASMTPPTYKTLLVSDVTPEALIKTHQDNSHGLGMFVDELSGWFQNFNRYSKGSDQEFWLSNWSFSPISVVRKSSVPIQIDAPFISVLGTIQPGILNELAKDGRSQNGFIDRILFAYPDHQQKPYDSEGEPDRDIIDKYGQCITRLYDLRDMVTLNSDGSPTTSYIGFSSDAFKAMKAWRITNTDLINKTDVPALKGIYAKLEAYCIRFCLLIELLDYSCHLSELTEIRLSSLSSAIKLTEYYRQNTEKVYSTLNQTESESRLSSTQQRLYDALSGEITSKDAVTIALELTPPVSERTARSMLKNPSLFKQLAYGRYYKVDQSP